MKKNNRIFLSVTLLFINLILIGCSIGEPPRTSKNDSKSDNYEKPMYKIGGTVSGLEPGQSLVIQCNGSDDINITVNGAFYFPIKMADGATYDIAVLSQPVGQTCSITNSSGTISGSDISNIKVLCIGVPKNAATKVDFIDTDTNKGEIAGDLVITKAADESDITHYVLYWGIDASNKLSGQLVIAELAKTGLDLTYTFDANTIIPATASYLLIYTKNDNGEMASGVGVSIYDASSPENPAEGIVFTDSDADGSEIGGDVTITRATDESDLSYYVLYWGSNTVTKLSGSSEITILAKTGANLTYTFLENTIIPSEATHLLVFTKNADGEMVAGVSTLIVDAIRPINPAEGIVFTDSDADGGEIGGDVTITRATDESDLSQYILYWGSDTSIKLSGYAEIATITKTGADLTYSIAANTPIPNGATHLLVFTKNVDGEMLTGVSTVIDDKAIPLQIAEGSYHSCAVFDNGRIKCWGYNSVGQLGNGDTSDSGVPVDVSGVNNATQITAGDEHTCARLNNGSLKCWGANYSGQLGDGNTVNSSTPVLVTGITNATQVAAGFTHTCALLSTGAMKCWGAGNRGKLGNGSTSSSSTPVDVTVGITNATQITLGEAFTCARLDDSTIKCWGEGDAGQLGHGYYDNSLVPVDSGLTNATQVDAGYQHTCALLSTGAINCWGNGYRGQLGNGGNSSSNIPVGVSGVTNATQVTAGYEHSCARLADGTLNCWGYGPYGQLGNGDAANSNAPVNVSNITNAAEVSAGMNHSCALLDDGTLKCWGSRSLGQLGDGIISRLQQTPVFVGIIDSSQISAGHYHACSRLSDDTIKCWGWGYYGQLGQGSYSSSNTPVLVSGITNGRPVSAGSEHTCTRLSDSTVKCWGRGDSGQLGDGGLADSSSPVIASVTNAAQVTVGEYHSCALLYDSTIQCWGNGNSGKLGDGVSNGDTPTPVTVSGINTATQVHAGSYHTCALLSTGSVQCWGNNNFGQIGDGSTTNALTPVSVSGISSATQVSGGGNHTCAVLSDGSVECWGWGSSGQLGNGSTSSSLTPVTVSGISNAVLVDAGPSHTCARLSDQTVKCWGWGSSGQLGDGSTSNSSTPVDVLGITGALEVVAGDAFTCARLDTSTVKCWGNGSRGQLGDGNGFSVLPVSVQGL